MVFIDRSDSMRARPDADNKVIKSKDFWTFSRAKQALADANEEKDRILQSARTAYEAEKRRGYREGLELAKLEQSANMIAIVSQTVDYFSRVELQMVDLVMDAVRRIVNDFSDREKVLKVVRNSLILVRNQKYITVTVHPSQSTAMLESISDLKKSFPSIERIEIETDPLLQLDSCIIESDVGRIEASMAGQISALKSTFEKVFGTSDKKMDIEAEIALSDGSVGAEQVN